jgi:hypothetical protein
VTILDLAHPPALEVREETFLILQAKREHPDDPTIHQIFVRRFGFPTDLFDLRRPLPAEGNSRPDGIADSYYARRERGELPEAY